MRSPMGVVAAFLLGLILASAWHRREVEQARAERDTLARAFNAVADSIDAQGDLIRVREMREAEQRLARGQR